MKLAVLTGGGDCPGLNAAIRAVVQTAIGKYGLSVVGIHDGFRGLLAGRFSDLTLESTNRIFARGGTVLGSSNVDTPFSVPVEKNGKTVFEDRSKLALENFKKTGADGLIVIGGDGTQSIANRFSELGVKVVGIPKTIDNDLAGTEFTIGFFTAVETAVAAIDKLHTTAESHQRMLVVEVMGRNAGWIALFSGLGGDADAILIPELPFDLDSVSQRLDQASHSSKGYSIVVVAEGARMIGGKQTVAKVIENSPEPIRLGGVAHWVAAELAKRTGKDARAIVLGHLLRGGPPAGFDRILASRFGVAAVQAAVDGKFSTMVAYKADHVELVPLSTGAGKTRVVDPESKFFKAAIERGIIFG